MKRIRSLKWLFALAPAAIALVFIMSSLRIVQFHYPRAVENDPLLAAIKVQSVSGNTIVLEDGRTVNVDIFDGSLAQSIRDSDYRVDLETTNATPNVIVYAKSRGWICGTPWVGLIEIPLIPDDVSLNYRQAIGYATIASRGANDGK